MSNKNSDYWRKRAEILEAQTNASAGQLTAEVERQFQLANKTLNEQIEQWYGRFAKNNQITLAEARQWLTGNDLTEFKWDVTEFIKYGKEAMIDPALMKQLENASARFHVSKLEALKLKTQMSVEKLYGQTGKQMTSAFGDIYKNNYYHALYEMQQGVGMGWDIAAINEQQLEAVLSKPWTLDKTTFSDRLWKQKQSLVDEVHTQLTQMMITGQSPDKAIKAIQDKFGASKANAARLIHTEAAYFANAADKAAYAELDIDEFEIVGTLDGRTCPVCGALDGNHLPIGQFDAGVTAPPFHPRCRCTTAPYFGDEDEYDGERIARDEDGKRYYVPQTMTYKEWKKSFADGGDKSGLKAIDNGGIVSWVKDIPVVEAVKKEYLTKKKLQSNIADTNAQMKDLEDKYGGDVFTNGTTDDMQAYVDLQAEKTKFEEMLQKKLVTEQKKALLKQQITLKAEFDALQSEVKTYSGIWKDDVTTSDWKSKAAGIQAKKDYFTQKINDLNISDEDTLKFSELLDQLEDFDVKGKHYWEVQQELNKVQNSLTNLTKSDIMKGTVDDAFTQARKDAALWAKTPQEADDVLRSVSGDVWRDATKAQKKAIYDYTQGSGGFNRPLRGYEGNWHNYKGVGNVDLNYEGRAEAIKQMTALIDKSTYDVDVWLQRGVESAAGAANFLKISESQLMSLSQSDLENLLLDKLIADEAFLSCGSAKGKGFSGYIFNVYCPKGTKMMYAEPFSHYGQGGKLNWDGITTQSGFGYEDETIIQRGTEFRITKVEKRNGNYYFDVEVVNQP